MGIKERWKRFKPLPKDLKGGLPILKKIFIEEDVSLVYLFGSLTKTCAFPGKGKGLGEDIDIAILTRKDNIANLRKRIINALDTERIDLLNLKIASPMQCFDIIKEGILMFKKDDEIENEFELLTLKKYKDTAYLRRKQAEILQERINEWIKKLEVESAD